MTYLRQVQRGVDYIEAHLDQEIALGDVAREAGISQWHFQRIFKALTRETLKGYIRGRRLSQAAQALLESDERVIEIALAAGYESQESFSRAFKLAYGAAPAEFRARGERRPLPPKVELSAEYLAHLRRVSLEPEIVEQPALRLVGLRTTYYGPDSEKNNMAEKLPELWARFVPRMEEIEGRVPGTAYGVIRQERGELLEYHAALQVTEVGALPSGMERVEVPAAAYARFTHRGLVADLDHTVNYVYSAWLLASGKRHSYGPDLEIYGPEYHPTSEESLIQYAIPLR